MYSTRIIAALGGAMLLAGAAVAKDKPEEPKEKKICKEEAQTNSRIPAKRICRTQEEWDAQTDASLRDLRNSTAGVRGN